MYPAEIRYAAYKRGVSYFIVYSIILFIATTATFGGVKTLIYFPIGFALIGLFASLIMSVQRIIENRLKPIYWILNIVIEIAGYYLFTQALFYLFFKELLT